MKRIFARNTTDTSRATAATKDTSGRKVPSEPAPQRGRTVDTRNAERGRGYLSGDGRMHQHRK